jgi:quercetin dioxygenase-like cupin family protein
MISFPDFIKQLPEVNIQIDGFKGYLFQGETQQIVFMEFRNDTDIAEHSHESQWEIVLEGSVDVWIDGKKHHFSRGDQFYIPAYLPHHARIHAGYKSLACFNQSDRYRSMDK